ncbi:septation protein A [Saccharobesus litoralis]|uniref:Inner membrane-spanning protein YciB n=1 Tax=Saccharobesus litoralis TaxID=2172099 RepID=A0A2S0VU27_9ALTE|nr:septation protein A [Saccharobesus litoralis]AWB67718.1 septation protein A [Saccharobesus litoralis]
MKTFLEYLPLIAFFAVYKTVDIYWATASLIATSALQIAYDYYLHKSVQKRHLIFFGIALLMGTLTIAFQDDTFIKWKVTVVNFAFALGILISSKVFNKNPLKAMLGNELKLPSTLWDKLAYAWTGFFLFCGALNLYIAYNFSQAFWVNFKVFGLTGLTLIFTVITIALLYPHLPKDPKNSDDEIKK